MPYWCVELRSFGGPGLVVPSSFVSGLPLATDQVSQGGANMAACNWLAWICCSQNWIVVGLDMSLCVLVESLERSIEIGITWSCSLLLSCCKKLCMSPSRRRPEKKYATILVLCCGLFLTMELCMCLC